MAEKVLVFGTYFRIALMKSFHLSSLVLFFVSYLVFIGIILIDEEIYNKLMGIDNMVKVVFLIAL